MNVRQPTLIEVELDVKEANQFLASLMTHLGNAQTASGGKVKITMNDEHIYVASGCDDGHGRMMWKR